VVSDIDLILEEGFMEEALNARLPEVDRAEDGKAGTVSDPFAIGKLFGLDAEKKLDLLKNGEEVRAANSPEKVEAHLTKVVRG
jgi:hypothetical protein